MEPRLESICVLARKLISYSKIMYIVGFLQVTTSMYPKRDGKTSGLDKIDNKPKQ